ncbi:MAG: DUF1254 domain-containing protein [Pseudomonadales bacterium]|nr:DUF1254 domain-containing protein [Pseudomonadales bacterium]
MTGVSNLLKLLSLTLISCALTTSLLVIAFPSGFIFLVQTMQVRNSGGWNKFYHMRELATANVRDVVKPNRDTLYSSAVIDLHSGPVVVHVPAYDKYWNVQMMDDRSDVFGYLGSRTHGKGHATTALIVPPGFSGDPVHLPVIEATSNKIWLVYRFLATTDDDLVAARKVQDQFALTPLADYRANE